MCNRMTLFLLAAMSCVGHAQSAPSISAVLPFAPEKQEAVEFRFDSLHSGANSIGASPDDNSGTPANSAPSNAIQTAPQDNFDADSVEESEITANESSTYVPVDSWVYAAFDRLAAMGLIPTSSATIRPWARLECARLLAEAHTNIEHPDETTLLVLSALDIEFALESSAMGGAKTTLAGVDNVYARDTVLAGTPLRDSFHFAQSLSDDFGRPYGKGENAVSGISVRAHKGMFSLYARGEYQYASTLPAYNSSAQQVIANYDGLPFGWNLRLGNTNRLRPIEAYVSMNFANWQISFGQQSLWWGPDRFTSLILSNNAEAMPMLRIARVKPIQMPSILGWVGPVHIDMFFARQGGIHYVGLGPTFSLYGSASQPLNPPPYIWGLAFSVKPTSNFELGFAHTTIFAGYGRPLTLGTFLHTFSTNGNAQAVDPGKRTTEFNLTYHLPGARDVVIYTELYAYDNPLSGRPQSVFATDPGIYIPRLPWLTRLDLRMEGVDTNLPGQHDPSYIYSNFHYPQGYTNYGQILGSWVGRQGDGGQASTSYWFSARNKAALSYRKMSVDKSFLRGGNLDSIAASVTWMPNPDIEVTATGQFEQWKFPLLNTTGQSDFATILEFRTYPKIRLK